MTVTRLFPAIAVMAALCGPGSAACAPPAASTVPAERLVLLQRGVNLPGWVDGQPGSGQPPSPEGLSALRAAGFTHIRLPVSPERLTGVDAATGFRQLDAALADLMRRGFFVSLDLHPASASERLLREAPDRAVDGLSALWTQIATRYRGIGADRIAFEILNETPLDAARWRPAATRLAAAIRAAAPDHTIIFGPHDQQQIDALRATAPLEDRNVVYAVHVYEPFAFTHQGMDWNGPDDPMAAVRGFPFPSSRDHPAVRGLMERLRREGRTASLREVTTHTETAWTAARLAGRIGLAGDWARQHGRPVIINEFGVLSWHAPRVDRIRWLATIRAAAEANCIGWTHWDFADGFGLATRLGGREQLDQEVVEALTRAVGARDGRHESQRKQ
jgi:endoglucanase